MSVAGYLEGLWLVVLYVQFKIETSVRSPLVEMSDLTTTLAK